MSEVNGMMVVDALLREHGLIAADEVWVHGMWTPGKWWACLKAKLCGKRLVRMTHGSLSPVYLERQGKWRKRLVKPIERLCFALADRVVTTGPWETAWCRAWGLKGPIEEIDLKSFFDLGRGERVERGEGVGLGRGERVERGEGVGLGRGERGERVENACCALSAREGLRVLYLGRRHPLKGVEFLERAVERTNVLDTLVQLRVVSDHFGEELERDWAWCDVLCLPTLSENFGLVVAEALERGKRVIVTDGAPAWQMENGKWKMENGAGISVGYGGRLLYLTGYRAGSDEVRVELLEGALRAMCGLPASRREGRRGTFVL